MSVEHDIKMAWQGIGNGEAPPPLRGSAARFDRSIRRRNMGEYAAGALVIAAFAAIGATTSAPLIALACALIVAGSGVVLWQLHRRESRQPSPASWEATPLIAHHRAQLARQHAALGSVALWYLAPLAPGLALFFHASTPSDQPWDLLAKLAATVALFVATWWVNRRAATDLAEQIAELDRLV